MEKSPLLRTLNRRSLDYARDDRMIARDDRMIARDDRMIARDDKMVARDDKMFARDDRMFARDDRIVALNAKRVNGYDIISIEDGFMDIKEYIIESSKKLNIDMIGFTNCEPLISLKEYLEHRMGNNISTEFEERDIDKRIDPKLTMPSCKSIIVIALSYNVEYNEKSDFEFKGSLSKSSWGTDYHRVIKIRIEALIEEIKKVTNFEYQYFVDTGPLIDRELAKKAGIGYYGKNCSIINEDYGSFIFIGYILTDIELDIENKEMESQCGDCQLCIRACPTNALEKPYGLNPKRCISYLTQTKNEVDIDLRKKMGIKIYGCDTCQMVCSKNKGVNKSEHEEFIPKLTKGAIDIRELMTMSNREFKEKYGSMAGSWRGKKILRRNAINVLKNIRNKDNEHLINELLKSE